MKTWRIGGAISGVTTALGLVLASGPLVALILVAGAVLLMLLYKADTILPAFGEMKIKIAEARRIEMAGNPSTGDARSQTDPAGRIQLPQAGARKPAARRSTVAQR